MTLVTRYLTALEHSDLPGVLALFSDEGIVNSPLYGSLPAHEFYPKLFADTSRSKLTLRRVLQDAPSATAFWFDFDWTLADGSLAPFTVIDLAELDQNGQIEVLHIVYDTHPIRAAFERARTGSR